LENWKYKSAASMPGFIRPVEHALDRAFVEFGGVQQRGASEIQGSAHGISSGLIVIE
jgi:hypothetical protein